MRFTNKTIIIDGHKLSYLDGGKSSDLTPPILFLHGWGLASKTFQSGLAILSRKHRVLAPDMPGFGGSDSSTWDWTYEDYAKVIQSFIKMLGIERAHLMGQSMGGGISIVLATLAPSVVSSLILIDSAGIPLAPFSTIFLERLIELPTQAWKTRFTLHHLGMIQAFLHNSILRTRNTIDSLRLSLSVDLRPILSRVNSPCLILWGANDRTIPVSSGQELEKAIRGSKLIIIPNAHHEWSALMPEKWSSIVEDFVIGVERRHKMA